MLATRNNPDPLCIGGSGASTRFQKKFEEGVALYIVYFLLFVFQWKCKIYMPDFTLLHDHFVEILF